MLTGVLPLPVANPLLTPVTYVLAASPPPELVTTWPALMPLTPGVVLLNVSVALPAA